MRSRVKSLGGDFSTRPAVFPHFCGTDCSIPLREAKHPAPQPGLLPQRLPARHIPVPLLRVDMSGLNDTGQTRAGLLFDGEERQM